MTQITIPRPRAGRLAVALAASAALFAGLANTASANVPDLIRVPASSATDSSSAKSATASCGVRRRLIGTAATISDSLGHVVLLGVRPNAELTAVTVTAHEDAYGTSANWSVTATAICANITGVELVAASFDSPYGGDTAYGPDTKSGHVYCPAGKKVVGTGGEVTGQPWGHVVLDGIFTHWTMGFVTFKAEEQTPIYDSAWGLTGYAICADPLPGLQLVGAETPVDSAPTGGKSVTAFCPSGKKLLGSNGEIKPAPEWLQLNNNDSAGKVGMVQLGPVNPLTQSVTVTALENQYAPTDDWFADAGAICASS